MPGRPQPSCSLSIPPALDQDVQYVAILTHDFGLSAIEIGKGEENWQESLVIYGKLIAVQEQTLYAAAE
jgi:hypothetical protein